jgi:fatty acid-binding protein DegV
MARSPRYNIITATSADLSLKYKTSFHVHFHPFHIIINNQTQTTKLKQSCSNTQAPTTKLKQSSSNTQAQTMFVLAWVFELGCLSLVVSVLLFEIGSSSFGV